MNIIRIEDKYINPSQIDFFYVEEPFKLMIFMGQDHGLVFDFNNQEELETALKELWDNYNYTWNK